MGTRARDRFSEWVQKHKSERKQQTAVTYADLDRFGKSMTDKFADMIKNFLTPASAGGVQTGSNGDGRAAVVNPPANSGNVTDTRATVTETTANDVEVVAGPSGRGSRETLQPELEPELELYEDDEDDNLSSWDFKRDGRSEADLDLDRMSVLGEGTVMSHSESDKFVDVLSKIVEALDISDASSVAPLKSKIQSSRCVDKRPQVLLPFDTNHVEIVQKIWSKDPSDIPLYKKVTKDRYKLTETDYNRFLKHAKLEEDYLVHELERSGLKVQIKNPKLPNRDMAVVEKKLSCIEVQSQLEMSCAVTQSWMLQFIQSQVSQLDHMLREKLAEAAYDDMSAQFDFKLLEEVCMLSQDAALDSLDLAARITAEAKWLRRSMWVDQTSWAATLKNSVKRFPTVGDGTLCGPQLKDKLEAYRLTSKALDASEAASKSQNRRDRDRERSAQVKRGKSDSFREPPPKRMQHDRSSWGTRGRGRGRGSGSYRPYNRSSGVTRTVTQTAKPALGNSHMSG
jgi:hypothetical protein